MKANEAPEKLYIDSREHWMKSWTAFTTKAKDDDIEYIREDAFIEKALKWYCLDCECNDNCKDTKCFFHNAYKRYLEGDTNNLPPKFSNTILNEDGSTSDNWRYRHFTSKMQDAFIEKACVKLKKLMYDNLMFQGRLHREEVINSFVEEFRKYMKGE